MLAELGAQQQKRHAEEIELEQSAMKARLGEEREAYQQELAVHKETAAEIAMAVKAPLLLDREYGAQWRINRHRRCL